MTGIDFQGCDTDGNIDDDDDDDDGDDNDDEINRPRRFQLCIEPLADIMLPAL